MDNGKLTCLGKTGIKIQLYFCIMELEGTWKIPKRSTARLYAQEALEFR